MTTKFTHNDILILGDSFAGAYFDMPIKQSPYMQFVAQCKMPETLPGICHVDNSSRVQTVTTADNPIFRHILEAWKEATGCPILMNTSLNIRDEPLVNTWDDAQRFQNLHGVNVY